MILIFGVHFYFPYFILNNISICKEQWYKTFTSFNCILFLSIYLTDFYFLNLV